MARTREIKPAFFKNDTLAECDPLARLLFAGLWTLADCQGRLECRPLRIKAEILPYDNCNINELLGQLQSHGFIDVYESQGVRIIEIPKFCDHQRPHPKEPESGLPAREDGQAVNFHGESRPVNDEPEIKTASCAFPSSNPSILQSSNPPPAPTKPLPRQRSKPTDSIRWSIESGWEGITDADRAEWAEAYPAADLRVELAKASAWLKANPRKAKKSNWRKWLTTTWLTRCQDRGGTHREAGARPKVIETPEQVAARQAREARKARELAEYLECKRRKAAAARGEADDEVEQGRQRMVSQFRGVAS